MIPLCTFSILIVLSGVSAREYYNIPQNLNRGASIDCFEAIAACRKNPECRAELHQLKNHCKVTANGHCTAKAEDLPRCGQISKNLFKYGLPENRCKCKRSLKRCLALRNKIYVNACVDDARKLLEVSAKNVPPQEVVDPTSTLASHSSSYSRRFNPSSNAKYSSSDPVYTTSVNQVDASDGEGGLFTGVPTTGEYSLKLKNQFSTVEKSDATQEKEEKDYLDGLVFGDEGFAKPPPKPRVHKDWFGESFIPEVEDRKPELDTHLNNMPLFDPALEENSTLAPEDLDEKPAALSRNRNLPDDEEGTDTNFRLIVIVLGTILGLLAVLAVVLFAWSRAQGRFFYISGKLVRDHRTEEEAHSKS